jgi:cytochrome c5
VAAANAARAGGPAAAAAAAATGGKGSATDGKAVFDGTCTACHSTGVAGAPKLGDKAAWAPRIAKGKDALYHDALNGLNAMPPKGGNAALSDDAVKAAVDYMVSQAK